MAFAQVWTSAFAILGIFSRIEPMNLRFYHGSLLNYTATPVEEPLRILPFFNTSLVSIFYMFGFNETANATDVTVMLSAYLNTGYTNVVLVDWADEARADLRVLELSYVMRALPNSLLAGTELGGALLTYIQNGISQDKIHLVGHALGAHVAGYAGQFIKERNMELARITGLDPAGPLFEGPMHKSGLNPSRAKFVDVIHTNAQEYGISDSIGSVDFWANCGDTLQPGCPDDSDMSYNFGLYCSHWRSYLIFSEAILSPTSIPAARADNCTSWLRQENSFQITYLGDLVDTSARGNYFFSTNSQQPLAKGLAGLVPNNQTSN